MRWQPLGDKILVRRKEVDEAAAPGSVLVKADISKGKSTEGEVVAVGGGYPDGRPLKVRPGNSIIFGIYAGTDIEVDGEELLVMREDDVVAVLREEG